MNPAFSVIFLTTLIGVGQGMFLALYVGQVSSALNLLPPQNSVVFYGYGSLLALLFLVVGLLASFFHLGHPERAWRSAAKWKTSWLSREVIVLPAFIVTTLIYAMIHINDWSPVVVATNENIVIELSLLVGAINTLLAFSLFISTAMIYACIKFLQEWATPLTVVNYTLLGLASGLTLTATFAAFIGSELVSFYSLGAIVMTSTAFITRCAALLRNTKIKYKSTLSTAIGIRHTNIRQKAQGAMGGSFNTREYFHGAKPAVFKSIKWLFLVLVFVAPVTLLTIALTADMFMVFVLAFTTQYIGLIAERWFFFAQANHPQNLYYQTI